MIPTSGSDRPLALQTQRSVSPLGDLSPVTKLQFKEIMAPLLALVSPAGMDPSARREWLLAASIPLREYPADLLERGARVAMATVDHPAKIVPAIIREIEGAWAARRRHAAPAAPAERVEALPAPDEPEYVTPAQAAAILAEYGFRSKYRPQEASDDAQAA